MTDTADQLRRWRAQLQAAELCRAVAADDLDAVTTIYEREEQGGQLKDLVSALGSIAASFAHLVEASDNSITAAALWDGLILRALIGLEGTVEIDWIISNEGTEE